MRHYLNTADDVLREVGSTADGLSEREARERLERFGKNRLKEGKKKSAFVRFFEQLKDPMLIILIVAAAVSGVTAAYSGESFTDVIIIGAVVLINAFLGMYQESKAEKAIEALQEMTSATSRVLRDGRVETVRSEELVPGDVILIDAGDAIPADARLIECASLKVEESALTGESVPVLKQVEAIDGDNDIPLGDRRNMVYMGGTAVYGRARAVVVSTGMDTEMGKIAGALANTQDGETPLQKKLAQLSRVLTWLVLGICVFMFAFSLISDYLRLGTITGATVLSTFMIAVSLAVAAIPEGLATVVTISLSIGVTRMSKRNAVIRKLTAVETLGCAQIICSDKTGTLTQNKMTVTRYAGADEKLIARAMALCSDAELEKNGAVGEPTECALVNYAASIGLDKNELKAECPRIGEAPFDSMRKLMSTVHDCDGRIVQYTKGAPDVLIERCTHYFDGEKDVPLTEAKKAEILAENKSMADEALRALMAARRFYDAAPERFEPADMERDLTYIGLVGMIDPVRPEAVAAVAECRSAGIRPIMITGDHRDTAVAIAKQLGIIDDASGAITGAELERMSDDELDENLEKYSVYARVQPEHKVRIVEAWRRRGMISAMTGDGVNDAPSIKTADIGVGMGITGTDVTKNVADMVLADDNFATIVTAVEEGRRIYDNIRKTIQFLLASNASEVLSVFAATIMGFTILEPVHLLWINLITDCLPALSLAMEKASPNIMSERPRSAKEGIFARGMGFDIAYQGVLLAVLTLAAYFIGHFMESGEWAMTQSSDGMTMAFLTMSLAEIFHGVNMRSQRGSLFSVKHFNGWLFGSLIITLFLTVGVTTIPFLSDAFGFEHISAAEFGVAAGLGVSMVPIVELVKLIERTIDKLRHRKHK